MATDPSLPGELQRAAARVAQLRAELSGVLVPVVAHRATLFWAWRGPQASSTTASLSQRSREVRRAAELLDDLARQLRTAAGQVQERLDEEARQRALAAQRAREAAARRARDAAAQRAREAEAARRRAARR